MDIRTGSVLFPALRGSGPRTASQTVIFPRSVLQAAVGLAGYSAGFSGSDHHLGLLRVVADHVIAANTVTVTVSLGVRDWSGDWDDSYEGTVRFSVLAELESASAPPRRGDMSIIDAEVNQATQFFRSDRHLDPANVRPDNSIPLMAGKSTGIRLYLDCDTASSVPAVTGVGGELRLRTPGGAMTVLPAISTIIPRREAQINRALSEHTLNFLIPEVWCRGTLDLTFEVFDPANPLRRSPTFERTLSFIDVAPLRVFCVGVTYTGQGLDVAAPAQSAFSSSLTFTERVYPAGAALITGYTTLDFSADMRVSGDGCGDGFNGILDALRDMRGDSSDIYVGLLQAGAGIDTSIDGGTSNVTGCGGGGVAAAFSGGNGRTLAQEIGHAFGRQHAPCDDPLRCKNPDSQDENYPHYGNYPSDSIGEFGFDPASNTVFDPASTYDFMGYSKPKWVSPYTYISLRTAFPGLGVSMAARSADERRTAARATETRPFLFLRLTVARNRDVTLEPSFHYLAGEGSVPRGHDSGFTAEFQRADHTVLSCRPLTCTCTDCDGEECWPKVLRCQVPFPAGTHRIVIYEGERVLYEDDIGEAHALSVRCERQEGQMIVSWSAEGDSKAVWFLLQWQDKSGVWRGVCPRTQKRQWTLPAGLGAGRRKLNLRLLACERVATSETRFTCEPPASATGSAGELHVQASGQVLTARIVGADGATDPSAEVLWYDEHGAELSHASSLDLRRLKYRPEWVRAAAINGQDRLSASLLRLEHLPGEASRIVGVYPDQLWPASSREGPPRQQDQQDE